MATGALLDVATDFPVLQREGLVYLDSAATAQKPQVVIDAVRDLWEHHNASVHRGVYPLAVEATDRYEGARRRIAQWLRWPARDTIFTKNATEALNLVAQAWGRANLSAGDVVVLTHLEHHSNIVPWQMVAAERGAQLRYVGVDEDGLLRLDELDELLATGDVKVVATTHVSNVTGTIVPVADVVRRARAAGAITVVDGSQAVPQLPVALDEVDADFYAWTGHKLYGPTGVGVLHGRHELLQEMPPFLGGGHMIASVDFETSRYADTPAKFEAGTSPIAEAAGLGVAVDWVDGLGMDAIRAHELDVTAYALERLGEVDGLTIHGPRDAEQRGALVSWSMDVAHPHDVAEVLGRRGVCIRAGHHCAQVLMRVLGTSATSRASFAVHTTRAEVDALVEGLAEVRRIFA
ncbi:SufS family cysteine desulfurase [Conexibacter sp. SYSU D00693]|uniref:SufS family cysteine desulfurase n=1 Tax=Conexibacter sp. SYSU D00693 TaxID=2812560 RepID=UPI00196ABC18|nr:SufS family cysteine desulfurase [Conexibacter sp. SYSU D00693]